MLQLLTSSLIGDTISSGSAITRELIDPATEETFHGLTDASPGDVERAAGIAHTTWEQSWRVVTPGKRADLLHKLAKIGRASCRERVL